MDAPRYAELFHAESREMLSVVQRALVDVEARPNDREALHALFRAVHTLKGMSASMGYAGVARFTHDLESLLDRMRSGAVAVRRDVMDALFSAAEALHTGIDRAVDGEPEPPALEGAARVLRQLADDRAMLDEGPGVLVRVRQQSGIVFPGVRAFMVLQRARQLGEVLAVSPPPEELQGAEISQAFAFRLLTTQPAAAIEAAVRAVGEVEQVHVLEGRGRHRPPLRLTPTDEPATAPGAERYVRIEVSRLDRLVNLIGALEHARRELEALTTAREDADLDAAMARASRLVAELQGEVMASRQVPAWHLFDRFPRLVRDAAAQLGKEITFAVAGRDLEIDRYLLDEIGEPVVHLLRNAVDHGIETPDARAALGKPRAGTVELSAERAAGALLVRVRDDGRGIDGPRVLARAQASGLIDASEAKLDGDALLRVLATPGFTLAPVVSDLSGRGVGLDAVYSRVQRLGGRVELATTPGAGTTVTLRF